VEVSCGPVALITEVDNPFRLIVLIRLILLVILLSVAKLRSLS